jgi:peptide chain release factor subunit 3
MGMQYNPMMMGNNQIYNPYVVDVNNQLNQTNKINPDTTKFSNTNQVNKNEKIEVEPKKQILTNPNNKDTTVKDTKKPNQNQNQNNQVKKEEKKPDKKPEKKEEKKPEKKVEEKKDDTVVEKLGEIELIDDSKEGKMVEVDENKLPVTLVFIGHVDHGKSTLSGQILITTGMVDERTIEKYQKEAKAKKRESWYIAYILDSNEDERERGKTVEIGKAFFRTPNRRFTILDAPGHSDYLPNMLQGACQADIACLVVSAKAGEFEAGFEKSGSTREHALLAKSLGVSKLLVLVNKMDEDTVKWSEKRFNQMKNDLSEFFKKLGYDLEKDVYFVPVSGLLGDNIKNRVDSHKCKWYEGPTLLDLLDTTEPPQRDRSGPLRISILDRYKEGGMQIMGKVESGTLKFGAQYTIMPSKVNVEISWIFNSEDEGVPYALPGESVRVSFDTLKLYFIFAN